MDAPDGTAARPAVPSSRRTSTSRVGLPRESRISRAWSWAILAIHASCRGPDRVQRVRGAWAFLHVDDEHGDVVPAAGVIGSVHQPLTAVLGGDGVRKDIGDVVVGDHVREAVTAKEKSVVWLERERQDVGSAVSAAPDGMGEYVREGRIA